MPHAHNHVRADAAVDPASNAPRIRAVVLTSCRLLATRHTEGQCVSPHSHGLTTFTLVVAGMFSETVGRRSLELGPLDLVAKSAGVDHANRYPHGATCFVVEVGHQLVPPAVSGVRTTPGLPVAIALGLLHKAFSASTTALELEEGVVRLGEAVADEHPPLTARSAPRWLELVRARIADMPERPPTLGELSVLTGVHPSHLCRMHRACFGTTIGNWARRIRVDEAVRRLTRTVDPLASISAQLGYSDQSHLTRDVQRQAGHSPARLRRLARTLAEANPIQDGLA